MRGMLTTGEWGHEGKGGRKLSYQLLLSAVKAVAAAAAVVVTAVPGAISSVGSGSSSPVAESPVSCSWYPVYSPVP